MKAEGNLVDFVYDTRFGDIPSSALETVKRQVLAVLGTTIAGPTADGCEAAVRLYKELAGKEEATILVSARLALRGVTGPRNFLDGIYGYFHLYGKGLFTGKAKMSELGTRWDLLKLVFKKYPSCALTAGSTEVMLKLIAEEALEARGHTPLDREIVMGSGKEYLRRMDIAPGFPGNEPTRKDHEERFRDCVEFAGMPIQMENAKKVASMVEIIETLEDIQSIIPLLISKDGSQEER